MDFAKQGRSERTQSTINSNAHGFEGELQYAASTSGSPISTKRHAGGSKSACNHNTAEQESIDTGDIIGTMKVLESWPSRQAVVFSVFLLVGSFPTRALYYWDSDGNATGNDPNTGAGLGGSGTWSVAAANWYEADSGLGRRPGRTTAQRERFSWGLAAW